MSEAEAAPVAHQTPYAPPWNREAAEAEFRKIRLRLLWFISTICAIMLVGLLAGLYTSYQKQGEWNQWMVMVSLLIFAFIVVTPFFSHRFVTGRFENTTARQGWGLNDAVPRFLLIGGLLSVLFGVLFTVSYFSLDNPFMGYLLLAVLYLILGGGLVIASRIVCLKAMRRFDLVCDDVVAILEAQTERLAGFAWETGSQDRRQLIDGEACIIPRSIDGERTGVTICTPQGQPARNRELREAVSAILEGRNGHAPRPEEETEPPAEEEVAAEPPAEADGSSTGEAGEPPAEPEDASPDGPPAEEPGEPSAETETDPA